MIDQNSARVTVFEDFGVSADTLYEMVGDFTDLSWVPEVPKVEFVGEGPGMVRNMYIAETLPPSWSVSTSSIPRAGRSPTRSPRTTPCR